MYSEILYGILKRNRPRSPSNFLCTQKRKFGRIRSVKEIILTKDVPKVRKIPRKVLNGVSKQKWSGPLACREILLTNGGKIGYIAFRQKNINIIMGISLFVNKYYRNTYVSSRIDVSNWC